MIKKYYCFFTILEVLLTVFATPTVCTKRCVDLSPDNTPQILTAEIERNARNFKEGLIGIEDGQEQSEGDITTISSQIDVVNDQIQDLIISQSVILKAYDFVNFDEVDDFLPLEELNELYEQIVGGLEDFSNMTSKATLEELENTLAQLQVEVTLLEAQIEDIRIQIENFILTNEDILWAAVQEAALLQLRKNEVPSLDFEAIFDGVAGFEEALDKLKAIIDFFCKDLCKRKKLFWNKLYKKPKPRGRIGIINFPGIYKITKNMCDGIIINSDNVVIDLNGHEICSDSHTPLIVASNHKNIIIKNGRIKGGNSNMKAPAGILINKGVEYILIENVDVSLCNMGVHFKGNENSVIKNCKIRNCTFTSNNKDIELAHTIKTFFEKCTHQ